MAGGGGIFTVAPVTCGGEYTDGLQPEPEDEVEVAGEEEQQQGQQGEV